MHHRYRYAAGFKPTVTFLSQYREVAVDKHVELQGTLEHRVSA